MLLVDDDPMVVRAVRTILEAADGIAVVASASDGAAAVSAVIAHHPDVVLMDLQMPGTDGVAATRAIAARPSAPPVVVLTTWDLDDKVGEALTAGAVGYQLKSADPADLVRAVRDAAAGHGALSPAVQRVLVDRLADDGGRRRAEARAAVARLSEQELKVVRAVADGLTNSEIATRLHLGETTVKSYLAQAQAKLGVNNRTQAALIVDRAT